MGTDLLSFLALFVTRSICLKNALCWWFFLFVLFVVAVAVAHTPEYLYYVCNDREG